MTPSLSRSRRSRLAAGPSALRARGRGVSSQALIVAAALALVAGACGEDARGPAPPVVPAPRPPATAAVPDSTPRFLFTDVAEKAGLTAVAWCGSPEKPHLLESGGNGVALVDLDGDGRLDILLTSGWRLADGRVVEKPGCRFYRNRGDGTFEDVTAASGLVDDSWETGVAVGDYDGDGRPDVLITCFGPDVLFHNDGGGKFSRVPDFHGIDGWSTGAVFFDADGDGDLDLYIAAYVDCTLDEVLHAKPTLDWKGTKVAPGPFGLKGKADQFFRNDGGHFVLATKEAGLTDVGEYYGFGVAAADLDGGGALDLYVANDSNPSYLYRNDGRGVFTEVGLWCGAGLSGNGSAQAGMGVAIGDFDGDGLPDILLTTFADDSATLFRNLGHGLFRDVSAEAGVRIPTFMPLKWGVAFADFDLDGDEDVFIACGHIYPQADAAPASHAKFAQRNLLLENTGGAFRDATDEAGPGLQVVKSSRGVAVGDYDDDGDVDILVSNVDSTPTLLRNDSPRRGHWLTVDAPGALRVVVEAAGKKQTKFGVAGGSFCSVSDPRFHFGLGAATKADRVTAEWPGGLKTESRDVTADRAIAVARPSSPAPQGRGR
jgi:hypothetical protein